MLCATSVNVSPKESTTNVGDQYYALNEKITIEKEGDSVTIIFADNKKWKCVVCDYSLGENQYINSADELYNQYISLTNDENERHMENIKNTFSAQQMLYLSLIDPIGVEHYMRTNIKNENN